MSTVYRPLNRLRRKGAIAGRRPSRSWGADEEDDLLGIERFVVGEPAVRIAANAAEQFGELAADDLAAEDFVVQPVVGQIMLVEEMAERSVADIVQQCGQSHQRLDVPAAGHVRAGFAEAIVERGHRPARQVHGPEHVLEPRMFGRGKNPPGGLQLMNLPEPLEPGVVDQFASATSPSGKPDDEVKGMYPWIGSWLRLSLWKSFMASTVLVRWLVGDGLSGIIVLRGRPADQALELAALFVDGRTCQRYGILVAAKICGDLARQAVSAYSS